MKIRSLFLCCLILGVLYAASTATVPVLVNVQSVFELTVDRNGIEFKNINPGEYRTDMPHNEGLKVTVKSNSGNPWALKISNLYELSNGSATIPNSNFYWYGYPGKTASGVWYGKDETPFALTPVLAYSSASTEYNNYPDGTDLFFKFALKVPQKQNSGIYRSVIAFTLAE